MASRIAITLDSTSCVYTTPCTMTGVVSYPSVNPAARAAPVDSMDSAAPAAPEDFNPFAWLVAEPLGPPPSLRDPEEVLGIASPEAAVRLRGGMSVDYGVPMRPADVITSVRRLGGYAERAAELVAPFGLSSVSATLRERVLPRLLPGWKP